MNWQSFGARDQFQVEWRLESDPDSGRGATVARAASWGAFKIWVHNRNLCQHHVDGRIIHEVHWYLLPMALWFVEQWNPLFHEERLEGHPDQLNARWAFDQIVGKIIGDIDPEGVRKNQAWQAWWRRHALRACRQGGLFPDIFFRRLLDFIEISWGNEPLPGMPGDFYFTAPVGTAYLPPNQVADPLYAALKALAQHLRSLLPDDQMFTRLMSMVEEIPGQSVAMRAFWYLEGAISSHASLDRHARYLTLRQGDPVPMDLFQRFVSPLVIQRFSPVDILFGSVSPKISEEDAGVLIAQMVQSRGNGPESKELGGIVSNRPLTLARKPYDEGYDMAMDLLDHFDLLEEGESWVDLQPMLRQLGVAVKEVSLQESNIRGMAVAGSDYEPTIVVNTAHPMNFRESGKRFTQAHELCHIIHDRLYGTHLALASGPWAPAAVEQRANAFASMLLMPYRVVNQAMAEVSSGRLATAVGVRHVADRLHTSFYATLNHLKNTAKITFEEHDGIILEWQQG